MLSDNCFSPIARLQVPPLIQSATAEIEKGHLLMTTLSLSLVSSAMSIRELSRGSVLITLRLTKTHCHTCCWRARPPPFQA